VGKKEEWPITTKILEINGIKRPFTERKDVKSIAAIATAKFACEFFGWDVDFIDKRKIAPYINAIGDIHGADPHDRHGENYANTALKILRGEEDNHLLPPREFFQKYGNDINAFKPFLNEVFKILGSTPAHTADQPANKSLFAAIQAEQLSYGLSKIFEDLKDSSMTSARKWIPIVGQYSLKPKEYYEILELIKE
jgi:hypothetical protein